MIVRRGGTVFILTGLASLVTLGGCRDATGPESTIDSPASFEPTTPDQAEMLRLSIAKADAGGRVFIVFDGKPDRKLAEEAGATVDYEYDIIPALAVRAPGQVISQLARHARVIRVEPDREVQLADGGAAVLFDHSAELAAVWGVQRIGAGLVHGDPGGTLGAGVKVGVLDTGCDYNHPDIADNYAGGYDFVNSDSDPLDDGDHGTHVSGTIAAIRDGVGVVGAAPAVELYCLKMLNGGGYGNFSDAVAAMDWAVANGLQVTNHSYSSSRNPGTATRQAFENAAAAGMISVAAAGNGGNASGKGNTVAYPARFETAIAVAATDASDQRASFSASGGGVELAAPGVLINSTVPGGGYATMSGTSMASPHVAGVAALLIAAGVEPGQVRARLQSTAEDLGSSGRDNLYGYGLVRADAAVLGVVGNTAPTASFTYGCTDLTCDFDASGSSDSDGQINQYDWDFGDGESSSGSSAAASHTYADEGTFSVSMTVTDDGGATDSDQKSVHVSGGGPPAEGPAIAFVSVTSSGNFSNELMVMNADGSQPVSLLQDDVDGYFYPSFSPLVETTSGFSGRIAYELWVEAAGQDADLKVVDFKIDPGGSVSTTVQTLVSAAEGGAGMAAWSPDGKWLVFLKNVHIPDGIWVVDYRGEVPGPVTQLIADPFPGDEYQDAAWPTWSPDGQRLAFTWCEPLGPDDCENRIRIVDLDFSAPGGGPVVVAESEVDVGQGVFGWALDWSRAGNYLAFKSGSAMRTLDVNGVNVIRSLPVTTYSDSPTWPAQGESHLVYMNRRGKSGSGKRRIVSYDLITEAETVLYERKGNHLYEPDWRRTP